MTSDADSQGNRPKRLRWFHDLGLGLFIHWSMDSQLGSVIGHSMAGASADYLRRFIDELPTTFHPKRFDADDWAVLARLAGMRYVVFTTKHHSGFCMFPTQTTDFSLDATPCERDLTGEVIAAFRRHGLAIGLYFSPDDFHFLHGRGLPVHRGVLPEECDGLLDHNRAQMRELLTRYGPIDLVFFDGPSDGLRELCWEIDPDIVVTRGAMPTPEQHIPGVQSEPAWEACVTMGTGWQYKPTNESYKSGTQLLQLLIETRAKGGNLLLNVGPKPDGELPIEQEALLREIALWHFVNGEAIHDVQPWRIPCEGDVWFTTRVEENGSSTLYAFLTGGDVWPLGQRRDLRLTSVRVGHSTTVQVLGQAGDLVAGDGGAAVDWSQEKDGLHLRVARLQRLYNNRRWPNPVVLRITEAQIGRIPPSVTTVAAVVEGGSCRLQGELVDLGEASSVQVSFERREYRLLTETPDVWRAEPWQTLQAPGHYSADVEGLQPGTRYEVRAIARDAAGTTASGDHASLQTPGASTGPVQPDDDP
jgi:alpha-L-fucosidase